MSDDVKLDRKEYIKQYHISHREEINKRRKKNKKYDDEYRNSHKEYYIEYHRKWKKKNKERLKTYRKNLGLKKYGITLEDFNQILEKQNYKCLICNKHTLESKPYGLVVDHNHKTENVRGLLCDRCNTGLGNFQDSIDVLQSAIEYLKNYDK